MDHGTEKLVAKIQHFYDLLTQRSSVHIDKAIAGLEHDERMNATAFVAEYVVLAESYRDVFKEFIYDEESE